MTEPFFWGNSSSSMQTEGAWNEGGKGLSVYDIKQATNTSSDWKNGTDMYHRYEEDFDLMKNLGINFYRFQISWSRICPTGDGDFNEEGLAFYDHYIDALLERDITPMICLYHFDMPLHLAQEYDGFLSKHVVDAFVRYAKKIIQRYADRVKYWVTFNEQNLYSTPLAKQYGGVLSDLTVDVELIHQIAHHVMVAHARVANYLHQTTNAKIGGMLAYSEIYPASDAPEDITIAKQWDIFVNQNLLDCFAGKGYSPIVRQYEKKYLHLDIYEDELKDIERQTSDYLAFSYYCSGAVSSGNISKDLAPNFYLQEGETLNSHVLNNRWKLGIDPLGFRDIIRTMYQQYRIPIFPVENGIGVKEHWNGKDPIDDDYRIYYHQQHIKALKDAIRIDGCEVLGYLGWGLIDLLSSKGDMEKRYGMVYVNRGNHELRDQQRVPKKSYYWFKSYLEQQKLNLKK